MLTTRIFYDSALTGGVCLSSLIVTFPKRAIRAKRGVFTAHLAPIKRDSGPFVANVATP
jgi:hypothetical protein